jgi:hypothetical protein
VSGDTEGGSGRGGDVSGDTDPPVACQSVEMRAEFTIAFFFGMMVDNLHCSRNATVLAAMCKPAKMLRTQWTARTIDNVHGCALICVH